MAGEPQRVVLSIQCWHSGTGDVPMLPVEALYPPFCKIFRIIRFAVFSRQILVSKEVMCLILLNHVLTRPFSPYMDLGRPAPAPCAGAMME